MPELRFRFEKRGRAAYLSHLDVMRTFQRAFIRAGVRLRHSEGFNPHPKMSIALPLQLGCESVCEVLDASLLSGPEDLLNTLNAALPEGIRVSSIGEPGRPVRDIAFTEWRLGFSSPEEADRAAQALSGQALVVEKKTKRGVGSLDIAPHLQVLSREGQEMRLRLRADSPNVNTGDVRRALTGILGEEPAMHCLRLRFLTPEGETFQ